MFKQPMSKQNKKDVERQNIFSSNNISLYQGNDGHWGSSHPSIGHPRLYMLINWNEIE